MSTRTVYLRDYTVPAYLVETLDLDIDIGEEFARVKARCAMRRNPAGKGGALVLWGEDMALEALRLDGRALEPTEYAFADGELRVETVPGAFVLETTVTIKPDENTRLSGLYRSKDGYFTQCEAEGFRRITPYPDRPDVMARFTCTLHADKARFPVLLSNGNLTGSGDEAEGRHWAKWEDPYVKPSYLFACVAAKLDVLEDEYTTTSGRRVRCAVYVEPGKLDQSAHAMAALKKSMKWDEDAYGLEMDLDNFKIVAVGDFNMGAMENKGLNIFNTKYVLARPDTATDADFQAIDRVVAHEYFHNWTGDRVTCRDWFQLSLKEGLTVFRDQSFGMDVHSAGVTRIQEVRALRAGQFAEDAGPMAHPVRPASYKEINNFYTATVYGKGAEVIGMIRTLIGQEAFRRGMDLYFQRHDGQAVTCEDFVAAMQDASGLDLGQFRRWYDQAGTPILAARGTYDPRSRRYVLAVEQAYPPTAYEALWEAEGHPRPRGPYHMPLVIGLLDEAGRELPLRLSGEAAPAGTQRTLQLREDRHEFVFEDVPAAPVPSLLRGFSAPVMLDYPYSEADLAHLMAFDTDAFNRWEAGQRLATGILLRGVDALAQDPHAPEDWIPASYVEAVRRLVASAFEPGGDPALVAEALVLPLETLLAERMAVMDPEAIHAARQALKRHVAGRLREPLLRAYHDLRTDGPYSPEGRQAGARAMRNACLAYLAELDDVPTRALLLSHYERATNMTDAMAALYAVANLDIPDRRRVLDHFYGKWRDEALVVDKWLQVQATSRLDGALADVEGLLRHEAFDLRNPNKVYALIRAFCAGNPRHFHAADGSGYRFAADMILRLDPLNPQVASRIARCFDRWRKVDAGRQAKARAQLRRIQSRSGLSGDVAEVVERSLGE